MTRIMIALPDHLAGQVRELSKDGIPMETSKKAIAAYVFDRTPDLRQMVTNWLSEGQATSPQFEGLDPMIAAPPKLAPPVVPRAPGPRAPNKTLKGEL